MGQTVLLDLGPCWLPRIRCPFKLLDVGVASWVIPNTYLIRFLATLLDCFEGSNELTFPCLTTITGAG